MLRNRDTVNDYDLTFNHYLKGEFIFDLITTFPLDLLAFAFPPAERMEKLCYFRLLHIFRLKRVFKLFDEWLSMINIK